VHGGEAQRADDPGYGHAHGGRVAVDRRTAFADHVLRVEYQRVHAGALLAREERHRDQRRFPDGPVRVQGPVRRCRRRVAVRADDNRPYHRRFDGGCHPVVGALQGEPFVHRVRLVGPALGPQPHGRLRQREQRDEINSANGGQYAGRDVPLKEHGQRAFDHHAQARGHQDYRRVHRPAARRAHFRQVQEYVATYACNQRKRSPRFNRPVVVSVYLSSTICPWLTFV